MKTEQKAIIISAFPCVGKSYLSTVYENVIDLETTYFQYELTEDQRQLPVERLKGTKKTERENWREIYIAEVEKLAKKNCIILIAPSKKLRELLTLNGLEYILVYPQTGLGEEYALRAEKRGNAERFIERIRTTLDEQIKNDFESDNNAKKHIVLKSGEFLTQALEKEKILQGFKKKAENYKI